MDNKLYILAGSDEGSSFDIGFRESVTIGRSPLCDIQIKDNNISRFHLKIQRKGPKYFIMDLGSKNGTFVDGIDLSPGIESELKEGIPIVIGMTVLGLGETSELSLKPFLDAAGFHDKGSVHEEVAEPHRVMAIKKNLEFIYNVSDSLMKSKDLKEISAKLFDNIFNLLKRIDRCVIIIINHQTGKIDNIIYRSKKPVEDPQKVYNRELVERALTMNKPVMVKDSNIMEDEDDKVTESLQLMKIRSAMCVPIAGLYGVKGAIYVDSLERPNGFRTSDVALLKDVGGRVAIAMDNVSL